MNIRGVAILVLVAAGLVWLFRGSLAPEWWDRKHPLAAPLSVDGVADGRITLADGRVFEPAGIRWAPGVDPAARDEFLRVVVARGVEIDRDLGDGRAFLRAEPRFYNWCGTCREQRRNWAGSYAQVPLSEYLVYSGAAEPDTAQAGLTARDRWRLDGVDDLFIIQPIESAQARRDALPFDAWAGMFVDYERLLAAQVSPPRE
ncbi:MAG: hypothetical protein R3B68_06355 [Phycisphaerales bacterium]